MVVWRGFLVVSLLMWTSALSLWIPGWLSRYAYTAAVVWDGGAATTDWNTAANWNPDGVPTSADDVTISTSATVSSTAAVAFNSLTIGDGAGSVTSTVRIATVTSGGSLTVRQGGVFEQASSSSTISLSGNLVVQSGGYLTHKFNSSTHTASLNISAAGLDIQSGGVLDGSSRGYGPTGYPNCGSAGGAGGPGGGMASSTQSDLGTSGGGYGGEGGHGNVLSSGYFLAGGTGYGSAIAPTDLGSSGANSNAGDSRACGGRGGGAVKITITGGGTATVDGLVRVNGEVGRDFSSFYASGGGSAGSFWIDFSSGGTFAGSGVIQAIGGNGGGQGFTMAGGGGGGGRIAITGHSSKTFNGTMSYYGGTRGNNGSANAYYGGPGTRFEKLTTQTNGSLYSDGNSLNARARRAFLTSSSALTLDDIYVTASSTLTITTSTAVTLTSSTLGYSSPTSTLEVLGTLTVPSSFTVPVFNQFIASSTAIAGVSDLRIDGLMVLYNTATSSALSLNSLYVVGEMTHSFASSTSNNSSLTISAVSSTITGRFGADYVGYIGGRNGTSNGVGLGGGTYGSGWSGGGGGYGGPGGTGSGAGATAGASNGSSTTPHYRAGSGGASGLISSITGGNGGGIVFLTTSATTTIGSTGYISANGSAGTHGCGGTAGASGGGSGGGIYLSVGGLAGSGVISANGGAAGSNDLSCYGGSGGGGRIMISAGYSVFSGTVTTSPGINATASPRGGIGSIVWAPSAPATLYVNATNAQGSSVSSLVSSTAPHFSAIYTDNDTTDSATKARIQVSAVSNFATTLWDSGAGGTTITSCTKDTRCQDLVYDSFGSAATTALALNDDADENSQTSYYWRLKYYDSEGAEGAYSATNSFTLLDAPNEPSSLTTSSVDTGQIGLSWTDNSSIEDSYIVDSSTDGVSFTTFSTSSANTNSLTVTGLSTNVQYTFRVRGYNSAGYSANATSSAVYTLAAVPSSLTATPNGTASIFLTWGANGNGPSTAYQVENVTTNATYSGISGTSYAVTGLTAGTTYEFRVRSVNGDNVPSSYTSTVSATTASGGTAFGGASEAQLLSSEFSINNGAVSTKNRTVSIVFTDARAAEYAISNTGDWGTTVWKPIPENRTVSWALAGDNGPKTVWARVQSSSGFVASPVTKSISLEEVLPPAYTLVGIENGSRIEVNLTQPGLAGFQTLSVNGTGSYPGYSSYLYLYKLAKFGQSQEYVKFYIGSPKLLPASGTFSNPKELWSHAFSGITLYGTYYLEIISKSKEDGKTYQDDVYKVSLDPDSGAQMNYALINNEQTYTNAAEIPIVASVKDAKYFWVGYTHAFGNSLYDPEALLSDPMPWDGTLALPFEGEYTVTFRAFGDSRQEIFKRTRSIIVDRQPPATPTIALTTNQRTLTVGGRASGARMVQLVKGFTPADSTALLPPTSGWRYGATDEPVTIFVDDQGEWSRTYEDQPNGSYQFIATGVDLAGNKSEPAAVYTVLRDPEVVPEQLEALSIQINDGAVSTTKTAVQLALKAKGATHMQVANGFSFAQSVWVPYAGSYAWNLASIISSEDRTVCVRFRNELGQITDALCDSIYAVEDGTPKILSFKIVEGTTTKSPKVHLQFTLKNATSYRLSNNPTTWNASDVYAISTPPGLWLLSGGYGRKTVTLWAVGPGGTAKATAVVTYYATEDVPPEKPEKPENKPDDSTPEKPVDQPQKPDDTPGEGPVEGDANGDGIPDSQEGDVPVSGDGTSAGPGDFVGPDGAPLTPEEQAAAAAAAAAVRAAGGTLEEQLAAAMRAVAALRAQKAREAAEAAARAEESPVAAIARRTGEMARAALAGVTSAAQETVRVVGEFVDNPTVEKATEQVVAPTAAVIAVTNVAVAVAATGSLPAYLYFIFTQPFFLLRRRRREGWGVVYNAGTRLPVDLALVRLVDATSGRIMQTRVSDVQGRFAFFASPGRYRIEVRKPKFTFPVPALEGRREDGPFSALYHGEIIEVAGAPIYLTPSIPMDPEEDRRTPDVINHARVKSVLHNAVSMGGVGVALVSLVIQPSWVVAGALVLHGGSTYLFRRLAKRRVATEWGVVQKEGEAKRPLQKAIVRLFDAQYNKLLETQVTTADGKYAFLVGPNSFYVTYEKPGFEKKQTESIVVTKSQDVIARLEVLRPENATTITTDPVSTTSNTVATEAPIGHLAADASVEQMRARALFGEKDS